MEDLREQRGRESAVNHGAGAGGTGELVLVAQEAVGSAVHHDLARQFLGNDRGDHVLFDRQKDYAVGIRRRIEDLQRGVLIDIVIAEAVEKELHFGLAILLEPDARVKLQNRYNSFCHLLFGHLIGHLHAVPSRDFFDVGFAGSFHQRCQQPFGLTGNAVFGNLFVHCGKNPFLG